MKMIALSKGTVVTVDDNDCPSLAAHSWYERVSKGRCYAVRPAYINGKRRQISADAAKKLHGEFARTA